MCFANSGRCVLLFNYMLVVTCLASIAGCSRSPEADILELSTQVESVDDPTVQETPRTEKEQVEIVSQESLARAKELWADATPEQALTIAKAIEQGEAILSERKQESSDAKDNSEHDSSEEKVAAGVTKEDASDDGTENTSKEGPTEHTQKKPARSRIQAGRIPIGAIPIDGSYEPSHYEGESQWHEQQAARQYREAERYRQLRNLQYQQEQQLRLRAQQQAQEAANRAMRRYQSQQNSPW